jgi:FkbM family methyltransferase
MFKINLHKHSEYISDFIKARGYWEKYTTEVLLELFKNHPSYVFLDIGANIGYYSLLSASNNIKTISFEPVGENYILFIRSITENKFNDLVFLETCAISDVDNIGKTIYISHNNMGICSFLNLDNSPQSRIVNCMSLDTIMNRKYKFLLDSRINFIVKIDVEAMELEVLNGMKKLLSSNNIKFCIIEIAENNLSEIFKIMINNNFNRFINIAHDKKELITGINHDANYVKSGKFTLNSKDYHHNIVDCQYQLLFIHDSCNYI